MNNKKEIINVDAIDSDIVRQLDEAYSGLVRAYFTMLARGAENHGLDFSHAVNLQISRLGGGMNSIRKLIDSHKRIGDKKLTCCINNERQFFHHGEWYEVIDSSIKGKTTITIPITNDIPDSSLFKLVIKQDKKRKKSS